MSTLAKESYYVKKTILLFAGLLSLSAGAQDSQPADTEQEAQTGQQIIDTELTLEELGVADNDELILGADEGGEESEEENSNSRFIPTEQISQDLGVSFPVDI
jgi:hypothetical protein|tara:strand:- start:5175 stop:5483 length:309 start_codon:yes stop_codon:yes gene_type:complete